MGTTDKSQLETPLGAQSKAYAAQAAAIAAAGVYASALVNNEFNERIANSAPSLNILSAPFNAVGDGMRVDAASMTSGSATLTTAPIFVVGDVGKYIRVEGAGVAGADLITTILSYTSSTQVALATSASTTVAAKSAFFGTNNSAAIQAAIDEALVSLTTRTVYVPPGVYLCNVVLKKNVKIIGASSTVTDQTILNTTAIQSREHASILLPAISTAAVIRANVDSFGCEVRDLNIVGSLSKVGYGVLGGNGWGNTGYSFGNANFEGLHVGGFAVAIGTSNATEVTVKRCSCNDSLTAFELWNIDCARGIGFIAKCCYAIN